MTKTPLLAALLATVALCGCEKTTVNPPATVVTTTVVPVPVPGPQGPAGAPGEKGDKGEKGDTTVVVPDNSKPAETH